MTRRRALLLGFIAASGLVLGGAHAVRAADPIKIGEINSYTTLAAFTLPYRNGWQLAIEEINAAGGVRGRPLEIISRDDNGQPGDAVKAAEELVSREKVVMLAGTYFSNVGLAVADFAKRSKIFFLATEPLSDAITWEDGNRYTFRLRPNTYMQADMLVEEAAKLPAKRWATIAPNYKYGQDAVAAFEALLKARRPDVQFVTEQWPAFGKIDAAAEVAALAHVDPEAIYNVTFGADLAKFVREGRLRGLFDKREVVSLLTGEPEYLDPLKSETPGGWIVTGYPWYAIKSPAHAKFLAAYQARFHDYPRMGSVVGYNLGRSLAVLFARATGTDADSLIRAARGMGVDTPFGPIVYRALDQQSTMGAYVGRTAVKDGKGIMVDWYYADGAKYLPSDEVVRKRRPAEAMR